MNRIQPENLRQTLLAALGFLPISCGGATIKTDDSPTGDAGGAGSPSGGAGIAAGRGGTRAIGGSGGNRTGGTGGTTSGGGFGGTAGSIAFAGAPAGGAVALRFPCINPQPGLDPSGNTQECAGGLRHRLNAKLCPSILPRPEPQTLGETVCFDSGCTEKANGHCNVGQVGLFCDYGCTQDSDCGPNQVCDCGPAIGTCKAAQCSKSADCGKGFLCSEYDAAPGCDVNTFACQTAADQCGSDGDCAGQVCSKGVTGARTCVSIGCAIGRPFLVKGQPRLAEVQASSDWLKFNPWHPPTHQTLDSEARLALAQVWTQIGQMEHASVAAFARFTLELLALGAPADLVTRSAQAQSDEIGHAQLAFRLASRFAGRSLGPGALAVDGSLDCPSLRSTVELAVLEGCVGETLAALEAGEALEYATDPEVRSALEQVSREESSHAELAFRFVRWALERDASLAEVIRDVLNQALRSDETYPALRPGVSEDQLLAHGILPGAHRQRTRRAGLRDVVVPCLNTLLAAFAFEAERSVSVGLAVENLESQSTSNVYLLGGLPVGRLQSPGV